MPRFRLMAVLTLIAGMLLLSACNTVRGVGRDVQKVGEKIESAARKH